MAQLKQVQAKLVQENSDHAQRFEFLVKEVEELRRGLIGKKMARCISQSELETSLASIKGIADKRISEKTAIMAQRDRQVDERLKLISETMNRRDRDVDKRMVDLMTTVHDSTLWGKNCSGDGTKPSFTCASGTNRCECTIHKFISNSATHLQRSSSAPERNEARPKKSESRDSRRSCKRQDTERNTQSSVSRSDIHCSVQRFRAAASGKRYET